jgi:hypothetical protein
MGSVHTSCAVARIDAITSMGGKEKSRLRRKDAHVGPIS